MNNAKPYRLLISGYFGLSALLNGIRIRHSMTNITHTRCVHSSHLKGTERKWRINRLELASYT